MLGQSEVLVMGPGVAKVEVEVRRRESVNMVIRKGKGFLVL